MEDQRLSELDRTVEFANSNIIAAKSKSVKSCGIAHFLKWIYSLKFEILTPAFLRYVRQQCTLPQRLENPTAMRLLVSEFGVQDFKRFIVDVQKKNENTPRHSQNGTLRLSISHLYHKHGHTFIVEFEAQLKLFHNGLNRTTAAKDSEPGAKLTEGKYPFNFSFYRELSHTMLEMPQEEYPFARLFLLLSWNLMCRAGKVVSIHHQHMSWHEDGNCCPLRPHEDRSARRTSARWKSHLRKSSFTCYSPCVGACGVLRSVWLCSKWEFSFLEAVNTTDT